MYGLQQMSHTVHFVVSVLHQLRVAPARAVVQAHRHELVQHLLALVLCRDLTHQYQLQLHFKH